MGLVQFYGVMKSWYYRRESSITYTREVTQMFVTEKNARIEQSVESGELRDSEIFFFKDNIFFEIVLYKDTSNIPLVL